MGESGEEKHVLASLNWRGWPGAVRLLDDAALRGLQAHEYVSGVYTPLDKAMNGWWEAVVRCVPLSVAPNALTAAGLLCVMLAALAVIAFDPWMLAAAPPAVYVAAGVALFAYQTLDAIDGKQARRTSSCSPLGELFDHGCDALSTFFIMAAACSAMALPPAAAMHFMMFFMVTFLLASWEQYHTTVLNCSNGWFGVTEGQLATMIGLFFTAAYSAIVLRAGGDVGDAAGDSAAVQGFWQQKTLGLYRWRFATTAVGFGSSFTAVGNLLRAFGAAFSDKPAAAGPLRDRRWAALSQLQSPAILVVCMLFLAAHSQLLERRVWLMLAMMGVAFAQLTSGIIVCHMTAKPYAPWQPAVLPVVALLSTLLLLGEAVAIELLPVALAAQLILYANYVASVISQLCAALNVACFSIKQRQH